MKIKRFGMMGLLACLLCCVAQDASAFYNSQTGRWLSRDPIEEEKGGINLHCAMGNNPANAVDASGLYLAAIDGTDSEKYVEHMQRNSFALNFYRDFTAPGRAGYWNGPSLFGGGVLQTVQDVYSHVCGALRTCLESGERFSDNDIVLL